MSFTSEHYRNVMGQYPTGVVAVTTLRDGQPKGMIVGTFNSVSLEPPIITFMPSHSSNSWAAMKDATKFCINVVGSDQEALCRTLASKDPGKFSHVDWTLSDSGHVVLDGAVAKIETTKREVVVQGDHDVVFCDVTDLDVGSEAPALLFYRGGYGAFEPLSTVSLGVSTDHLRAIDATRVYMDRLAEKLNTEVSAVVLQDQVTVLAAASGRSQTADFPTRVGVTLPFMPPMGGTIAAWGSDETRNKWISGDSDTARSTKAIENILARGYAIGFGHDHSAEWERLAYEQSRGKKLSEPLADTMLQAAPEYNMDELPTGDDIELRLVQAPVFDADGKIALAMTMWGPAGTITRDELDFWISSLLEAAQHATQTLAETVTNDEASLRHN